MSNINTALAVSHTAEVKERCAGDPDKVLHAFTSLALCPRYPQAAPERASGQRTQTVSTPVTTILDVQKDVEDIRQNFHP